MNTPQTALVELTSQAEGLWQAVAPWRPDFSVEIAPSIDSTNTELMRRARTGELGTTVLVALEQTAGRGRRGKPWLSQPGASLTFSLGTALAPADWSGLSLAVGVSLAEAMDPAVRLKWPNDLWWQGRKLGGILVETASMGTQRALVVGIGLNVWKPDWSVPPAAVPEGAEVALPPVPPAGLQELGGEASSRHAGQWLARLVPKLLRDLQQFEREGFAAFVQRFAARDALHGLRLRLSDGQEGMGDGVDPDGSLRLQTAQGLQRISHAEVSVRPC